MSWLGVAPNPLRRDELLPDNTNEMSIQCSADIFLTAIQEALSLKVKKRASRIAEMISKEVHFCKVQYESITKFVNVGSLGIISYCGWLSNTGVKYIFILILEFHAQVD